MSNIRWGDTLPDGTASPTAWKGYGFDLDGLVSTARSTDLCLPAAGASKASVYPDGDRGIDNSFGKNILPIFLAIDPEFATLANFGGVTGQFTLMLDIDGLGSADTAAPTPTRLYGRASLGGPRPRSRRRHPGVARRCGRP